MWLPLDLEIYSLTEKTGRKTESKRYEKYSW
jgi:hypothetical protein